MKRTFVVIIGFVVSMGVVTVGPAATAWADSDGPLDNAVIQESATGTHYDGTLTYIAPDAHGGAGHTYAGGGSGCGGCSWEFVVACADNATPGDVALCNGATQSCPNGGVLNRIYYIPAAGQARQSRGNECIGGTQGLVTPADVFAALPAFTQDSMGVPDPSFAIQPASGAITNLPMIVYGDNPGPRTKQFFGVLGFTVEVTATPTWWNWTFSNGQPTFSTTDPGLEFDGTSSSADGPYPSGHYIAGTFTKKGTGSASLATTWIGTASIPGGPTIDLPPLQIPAVTQAFDIREARGRLIHG